VQSRAIAAWPDEMASSDAVTRSSRAWSRPAIVTRTPLYANQRAVSAPIPPEPPVINAVLPARSGKMGMSGIASSLQT